MTELKSRISYLKGLADGMELSDTKEKRLMMEIISVVEDMSNIIEDLELDLEETIDYVESIDEDLGDLEETYYGEEDDQCDCEFEDEDYDDYDSLCDCDFCEDDFVEVECQNCHEVFHVDEELIDEEGNTECPHCGSTVIVD